MEKKQKVKNKHAITNKNKANRNITNVKQAKKDRTKLEKLRKTKTNKKKDKLKKSKTILKILLVIVLFIIFFWIVSKNNKNIEKETFSLIIDNQDITSNLENEIIEKQDVIYISFEDIQKYIDKTIYKEPKTGLIITSSDKKLATLRLNEDTIKINGSNVEINGQAFEDENHITYLPISELEKVYDIECTYIETSKNIIIDYYSKGLVKAYTAKKVSIKEDKSNFSKTLLKIKKGNWVIVTSEEDGWAKIRTQDGYIGYVELKNLTNFVTEREDMKDTDSISSNSKNIKVDITNKNLENYEKRESLINKILLDAIEKECKEVKIIYNTEKNEEFERFKIEVQPILKECGIKVIF